MIIPCRNIWDTRIQCVCGIVLAQEGSQTDAWACGNYGQVSLDPPRIIVNPNRLYPIEMMLRRTRRFSLNVMPASAREEVLRFMRLRRREPRKIELMGWGIKSAHGVPFLPSALRSVFCEIEEILETGDHTVMIGRVLESRSHAAQLASLPLMSREVFGGGTTPLRRHFRKALVASGFLDVVRSVWYKRRPLPAPDLPGTTYQTGGQTDDEVRQIMSYGGFDHSRRLQAPTKPIKPKRPAAVCVVGTRWGAFHCQLVREADPSARLFVCGREPERTRRLAMNVKAEDCFIGLDAALQDKRVEAVVLALPPHDHRTAAEMALAAGKHVLVEKPIATTLEDADAMIDAAHRFGRVLMVAEDMHFRPAVSLVQQRIDAGDIGEPLHLLMHTGGINRARGWVADRSKLGGGVFMDIGVHYVRALRLLLGEPDDVSVFPGMQINTKMTGEDSLQAVFGSRYGWQAHLLTTWSSNFGILPDIILMGESGTFHLWPGRRHVDYYPAAPRWPTQVISYVRPYSLQARLMRPSFQRVRLSLEKDAATGYLGEMREFLATIANESAPVSHAEDARRDLEIVLAVYRALASGVKTAVPEIRDSASRATSVCEV